jgi:hypothetical protein
VEKELVADHRVGDEDNKQPFLHDDGVGIGGVGDANQFDPFFPDAMLK